MATRMERLEKALIETHGWRCVHHNEWDMKEVIHGDFMCTVCHITAVFSVRQDNFSATVIPRTFWFEDCIELWQGEGMVDDMVNVLVHELVVMGIREVCVTGFSPNV